MRSWTSSTAKYSDKLGEDAGGTDHAKSTAKRADNRPAGKKEEEETDQTGLHPRRKAQGVFRSTFYDNAGHCQPERPNDVSARRQDAIVPTTGAAGAPTSCHRSRGYTTQRRMGGGGRKAARRGGPAAATVEQRAAPPFLEANQKQLWQEKAKKTMLG